MASKPKRTLKPVGHSQKKTEKRTRDKFSEAQDLVQKTKKKSSISRTSPQICCTVGHEEKRMLDELTLYVSNKRKKVTNVSTILRSLIRLSYEHKEELEFE